MKASVDGTRYVRINSFEILRQFHFNIARKNEFNVEKRAKDRFSDVIKLYRSQNKPKKIKYYHF